MIPITQNGFQEEKGTDNCIITYLNIIENANKNNKKLHIGYVDFAKTFDLVEHWVLEDIVEYMKLGKLEKRCVLSIKNSYTQIELAHGLTKRIKLENGTKQGDIISLSLFILFLSPLLWKLEK